MPSDLFFILMTVVSSDQNNLLLRIINRQWISYIVYHNITGDCPSLCLGKSFTGEYITNLQNMKYILTPKPWSHLYLTLFLWLGVEIVAISVKTNQCNIQASMISLIFVACSSLHCGASLRLRTWGKCPFNYQILSSHRI